MTTTTTETADTAVANQSSLKHSNDRIWVITMPDLPLTDSVTACSTTYRGVHRLPG